MTRRANAQKIRGGYIPVFRKVGNTRKYNLAWRLNVPEAYQRGIDALTLANGLAGTSGGRLRVPTPRQQKAARYFMEMNPSLVRRGYEYVLNSGYRAQWKKKRMSTAEKKQAAGFVKLGNKWILTDAEIAARRAKMHARNTAKVNAGFIAVVNSAGTGMVWRKDPSKRPQPLTSKQRHQRIQNLIDAGELRAIQYGRTPNKKTRYIPFGPASQRQRDRAAKRMQKKLGEEEFEHYLQNYALKRNERTGRLYWAKNTQARNRSLQRKIEREEMVAAPGGGYKPAGALRQRIVDLMKDRVAQKYTPQRLAQFMNDHTVKTDPRRNKPAWKLRTAARERRKQAALDRAKGRRQDKQAKIQRQLNLLGHPQVGHQVNLEDPPGKYKYVCSWKKVKA